MSKNVNVSEILLTTEGVKKLKTELIQLVNVDRVKVINDLQKAYANRDLKENFDYIAAKISQGEIEQRIIEIEYILSHYKTISNVKKASDVVRLGSTVIYDVLSNKTTKAVKDNQVKIVGSVEYDPFSNPPKISSSSPLAQVLLKRKVNETILVKNIDKPYNIKIKEIK